MSISPIARHLTWLGRRVENLAAKSIAASIGLVVLSACVLATQDALVKGMVQEIPTFQLIWLRFTVHAIILMVILYAAGQRHLLRTRRPGLHCARTVAILATGLFMFAALKELSLATATVILFLSPVLVSLLSTLFLGERIGPRRYIAIFFGFVGVVVVIDPSFNGLDVAMIIPLGAAISAAVYVLMTRQLSDPSETMPTLLWSAVAIAILFAPLQFFIWEPLTGDQILKILLMGSCGALGHASLQFGLRGGSAALLSPFLYAQVAFASALSIVFFGDPLRLNLIMGIFLIVGSGLAIWYFQNKSALSHIKRAD